MLTVILAGGKGTRLLEETQFRPKALTKVGEKPILEHIMEGFQSQGYRDFLILTGYKSEMISEYFRKRQEVVSCKSEGACMTVDLPYARVRILDTGEDTGSAARLRMAEPYLEHETFLLTYCDGLCSVEMEDVIRFHRQRCGMVTLTAVRPEPRFGILEIAKDGRVNALREKERKDSPVINGGFMVMEPEIFEFLTDQMEQLEKDVLVPLSETGKLMAYYHDGFWQCMDTLQEKKYLCALWEKGNAPWINQKKDR